MQPLFVTHHRHSNFPKEKKTKQNTTNHKTIKTIYKCYSQFTEEVNKNNIQIYLYSEDKSCFDESLDCAKLQKIAQLV